MGLRHLAAAVAILGSAACVVPLQTADQNCVSYCSLLQACQVTGAPNGDCGAWCSAFSTELTHVGCKGAFDDAAQCVVGEGTCYAATCSAETATYQACTQAFCAKNPSDNLCVM